MKICVLCVLFVARRRRRDCRGSIGWRRQSASHPRVSATHRGKKNAAISRFEISSCRTDCHRIRSWVTTELYAVLFSAHADAIERDKALFDRAASLAFLTARQLEIPRKYWRVQHWKQVAVHTSLSIVNLCSVFVCFVLSLSHLSYLLLNYFRAQLFFSGSRGAVHAGQVSQSAGQAGRHPLRVSDAARLSVRLRRARRRVARRDCSHNFIQMSA